MSGGSWNYLCHKSDEELLSQVSDDEWDQLEERLAYLKWVAEANKLRNIRLKINAIRASLEELDKLWDDFKDIAKAIEWKDSGDGSNLYDELCVKYDSPRSR